MIWMDRRSEDQAAAVAERISPADFYAAVGANLDSSHAAFKALWVRDDEPEAFAAARWLLLPGSYVLLRAAGIAAVDSSNASSLALLDPRSRTWSERVLDATGLDAGPAAASSSRGRSRWAPSPGTSPRRPGSRRTPSSSPGAATRWPRRSAPACSRQATCATWWARPSPCARPPPSPGATRRCWSSATRTPTPTCGCWRTRASSRAAASAGGATSSRPPSGRPRSGATATRTTCSRATPRRSRPAPRAWSSSRVSRARWRRSGTARPGASSTA